ncbi:putative zinc finger protein At1g68190 [Malus domestica]|uniref:putative zinc finger protein At1g68190 n=1 Tax=Malus domestica TaxID=3750 RepID=UPI003976DB17
MKQPSAEPGESLDHMDRGLAELGFQSFEGRKIKRFCEFCLALRPVVYCKADAAHLCLSCDAKVHSANTLFNRHMRSILCDSCRYRPAYIQCLDHKMFMCCACESALHMIPSQHQKRAISCYTGSPLAKDLSNSCGSSCDSSAVNLDGLEQSCSRAESLPAVNSLTWIPGAESEAVNNTRYAGTIYMLSLNLAENVIGTIEYTIEFTVISHVKVYVSACSILQISHEGQEHNFILHQILDLKRLQLAEGNTPSLLIRGTEQIDLSSSVLQTSKRLNVHLDRLLQHSQNSGTKFRQRDSLVQELKVDHLSFPFSQMELMQPSSTAGLPLHTESFWQCRSTVQSNQLWPQNMQDIGVCEELVCPDDFNIPDVDMTFQNFEELFGGDQDPIRAAVLHDKDVL